MSKSYDIERTKQGYDIDEASKRIAELQSALRICVQALYNVPLVGDIYDQQHSDVQMKAVFIAARFIGE